MKVAFLASALFVLTVNAVPLGAARASASTGQNQPAPRDVAYPGTLTVHVDATDIFHRIFRVHETIPVTPGSSLYLLYPKWLPGTHGPVGPIAKFAGLEIRANGKRIPWTRDKYNVYAFHVEVPNGVIQIDVSFQFLSGQTMREWPVKMTPEMLGLSWNTVSLYPAGYYASRIKVVPSVTLPAGWKFGTALEVASTKGNTVTFKPIDYANLVDSPIYAGKYFKRVDLTSAKSPPIHLNVVADSPRYLAIKSAELKAMRELVVQMYKIYGAFHFNHYDFLLSLSTKMSPTGLEHHRSSEDGTWPGYFVNWSPDKPRQPTHLLAHEFNHTWDGKYRRPLDSDTPNFNVPMGNSLLWVYEGQTAFWAAVVDVRAGVMSKALGLQQLAHVAATYDMNRPGLRSWRNIQDTTNDPILGHYNQAYPSYQSNQDYYAGGKLIWLAVDGKMRALSDGKRSLDDFAHAFFGMNPGAWDVSTYTFEDVVATLDKLVPYDWKTFLRTRLDGHADLAMGLALEGWKLVYTDTPTSYDKALNAGVVDMTYSVGLVASPKGRVSKVRWNGPAFNAGLSPGTTILAVNGNAFSAGSLITAVRSATGTHGPIDLKVKQAGVTRTLHVDYHDGPRYPHLVRIKGSPDYLSDLYKRR